MLLRRSILYTIIVLSILVNGKSFAYDNENLVLRKEEIVSPWYLMIEGQIKGLILRISDLDSPPNENMMQTSNASIGFINDDSRPIDVLLYKDNSGLHMKFQSTLGKISLLRDGLEQAYEGRWYGNNKDRRVLAIRIEEKDIPNLLKKESYYKSNGFVSMLNPEFFQKFVTTKKESRTSLESKNFLAKYNHIFQMCFDSDCHIDVFRYYRRTNLRVFFESQMTEDAPRPQFASEKSITDWSCHWDNGQYIFDIMDKLYPPSLCKEDVSRIYFETKEIIKYKTDKRREDEERHASAVAESKAAQKRNDEAVKKSMAKEIEDYKKATAEIQANVKRGSKIAQGLVIEVDRDLVQVQAYNSGSIVWIKRSDIRPYRLPPGFQ